MADKTEVSIEQLIGCKTGEMVSPTILLISVNGHAPNHVRVRPNQSRPAQGPHLPQCCVESSLVAFPTAEDRNMANETQRQIWSTAGDWSRTEPVSDYGTPLLMEALQLRPGERVIDIGCGGAKATVAAARAVGPSGHATGVDIAQGMIDIAKRRRDEAKLDNIELAVCDAQVDAFPSGPFDAALSQFGIMFFDQPISALQNIKRQMNPGGRVAFTVWSGQHISLNPGPIVAKYLASESPIDTSERVRSWGDPTFATSMLTSAGFGDVRVVEHAIDAEVPPDTDIPESILIASVGEEHRDAVLADWREHRAKLVVDGVMHLDLRMCLVTARLPGS